MINGESRTDDPGQFMEGPTSEQLISDLVLQKVKWLFSEGSLGELCSKYDRIPI